MGYKRGKRERERKRWGGVKGRKMYIGVNIKKKKKKSKEGDKNKKYRSVHWNNVGSLIRDNGLDQCFL